MHSSHQHMVGHSICCVQNKDKVLENVHANPSTSTDWAAHETGLSQRESVWCMLSSCILYMYIFYKDYSQGAVMSPAVLCSFEKNFLFWLKAMFARG